MSDTGRPLESIGAQALWDAAPDGLVLIDEHGSIVATNLALEHLFGHPGEALVGQPVECLIPHEVAERHVSLREDYVRSPTSRPMGEGRYLEGLHGDGHRFPVHISLSPLQADAGHLTLAAVRDMSDRVRFENALGEAQRDRTVAEEHDRIARELHDTVIQELFAVGLGLQGVQTRAESPEVGLRIAKAVDDIDETIRAIRYTIYELHDRDRQRGGARERIAGLVTSLSQRLGFEPKVRMVGPVDAVITDALVDQLEPAVREALTNVARHADATTAEVTVTVDDQVTLVVTDNGRGLGNPTRRSGLANLAERAARLGGAFEVRARDEGGTVLRWSVPAPNEP